MPAHPHRRLARGLAAVVALLATTALAGCSGGDGSGDGSGNGSGDESAAGSPDATTSTDSPGPSQAPDAVGTLGPGFLPDTPPIPEGTITPAPGSWDDVHPAPGYHVVLLTSGDDRQTTVLVGAVTSWASEQGVELDVEAPSSSAAIFDDFDAAIAKHPDLIVTAGDSMVNPASTVTAGYLDQQFLVVGAELAEPTVNVTAADWAGASFRGEGLGQAATYDPASFTPERAARAVRAGVAAVLTGNTGIVVWLD